MTDRYMEFETKSVFTDESFGAFGANAHVLDVSGEDITGDHQYIYPKISSDRVQRPKITGPKKFSGPIDVPIFPREAISLIYYALGTCSTTTDTPITGLNEHNISKAKTIPFFRAAFGRDQSEHKYVGGIVNSMTLDYSPDELISGSFDTVFRKELTPGSLRSPTFADFNSAERAFGGVETSVEFDDSVVTFVESFSTTVENNVADDAYALGSEYLPAGIIAEFAISGSMDLRYDSNSNYTDWLNGTDKKIEIIAQYGTGAAQRLVEIELPDVAYDVNNLPTTDLQRYIQTLDFTPQRDSNGDPILVRVVNDRSNAQVVG